MENVTSADTANMEVSKALTTSDVVKDATITAELEKETHLPKKIKSKKVNANKGIVISENSFRAATRRCKLFVHLPP